MAKISLFHGSDHEIIEAKLILGKKNNDYGQGFYCTKEIEMAKEWACKNNTNGFVNEYVFDDSSLKVLNLNNGDYSVLNWIAILIKNRTFTSASEVTDLVKEYLINNFAIDTTSYDVIVGYRADDSYFQYADSFVSNGLSVRSLAKALMLGKLGEQITLVSEKAFEKIKFVKSEYVDSDIYYLKYKNRDDIARQTYRTEVRNTSNVMSDIFALDIIRQEIKNDDPRIPRIILK